MQKNTASQKWRVFAFNRTTNAPVTGDAANITAKISKDFATAVATNDTNPTEVEDGYYEFDLTQAETDASDLLILPESVTANVTVLGCPAQISTTPASFSSGVIQTGDAFARIGSNGGGLTGIPWSAAWDAEVQSEVADGLTAFWTSPATLVGLVTADMDANSTKLASIDSAVAALNDISVADILTTQITESYAADGAAPTISQALMLIQQQLGDFAISGTTLTVRQLDGATTAATFTLNDGTNPTGVTRTA